MVNKNAAREDFDLGFEPDDDFGPMITKFDLQDNLPVDPFTDVDLGPSPVTAPIETFSDLSEPHVPMSQDRHDPNEGDLLLPRVAIAAHYVRSDTAALLSAASADRRMVRTEMTTIPGGLVGALDQYRDQPTPSLLIIESLDSPSVLLKQLDQLAMTCDPGTKVIVIGSTNDISLYRDLIKQGVSDYLTTPMSPVHLIRAISNLYSDPSAPFIGRQVAVLGVRGGVGASSIAHNLAWALAEHLHIATLLVDYDLAYGTAGLSYNQEPSQGVYEALSDPERMDSVLMDRLMLRCSDRLSVLAAPASLELSYEFSADSYELVNRRVRESSPYSVLDMPNSWTAGVQSVLQATDELVLVATPDLSALRNAKNLVDLIRKTRPNDLPPRLVLNQVGMPGRPEIPIREFSAALNLAPSLVVPFDARLFGQAANRGQMLAEVEPNSKVVAGLDHLARTITRRQVITEAKPSFLGRWFRKA